MNLVFGVEQGGIAVRALQAVVEVVPGRARALSRGIGVAQRDILANADSMCGGRQREAVKIPAKPATNVVTKRAKKRRPRAVMAGNLHRSCR